jgi:hypothetical protein
MASFSATDAAFEGFRIAREKPVAILAWAGLSIVFSLISMVALISLLGPQMAEITAASRTPSSDPSQAFAMLGSVGKLYAIVIPLALLQSSLITCAVMRAVLRPNDKGFGYLKFGGDEIRMILMMIVMFFVWIGVGIAVFVVMMILGLVVGLATGAANAAGGGGAAAVTGLLTGLIALVLTVGLFAWIATRLSLAAPMTFAEGRVRIFESWKATEGKFWPMLGAYVLAFVMAVLVAILGFIIVMAISAVVGGGVGSAWGAMTQPDYSSFGAYFTAATVVTTLVWSIFGALYYAIILSPAAVIYRSLKGPDASTFA